ncbi:hypothetical protein M434DRAFT_37993 [Hypoxylon sp. CO27-5]|nr:hypothetical protein M434DRAFT_37993 [Hypoxylon sp. CO27-5]
MRFSAFSTALVFSASSIFAIAVPEAENVAVSYLAAFPLGPSHEILRTESHSWLSLFATLSLCTNSRDVNLLLRISTLFVAFECLRPVAEVSTRQNKSLSERLPAAPSPLSSE